MLWPLVLPVKITFWIMVAGVVLATVVGAIANGKPARAFLIASTIALILFIPSCVGIMSVLDARRFGVFQYASFDDVQDFRIERFLPTKARSITLEKKFIGHRAKYSISETELTSFLDQLWEKYGEYSAIHRSDLKDGTLVNEEEFELEFRGLDWPPPKNAVRYHSPVERDGGGATYFFDPTSGTAYHRAGYW